MGNKQSYQLIQAPETAPGSEFFQALGEGVISVLHQQGRLTEGQSRSASEQLRRSLSGAER